MGRRTVLLIAAIVVAALGTTLIFAYVHRTDERALEDQKPVNVLVAKTVIRAGTTGQQAETAGAFRLQAIPKAAAIEGYLQGSADIANLVAVSDIFPGEQIIKAKFAPQGSAGALPIPLGKIGASFQLGDPERVAGFVRPGSEVVIFFTGAVTQTGTAPGTPGTGNGTVVLLGRVQVLAVGPTTNKPVTGNDANKESVPTAILTLALDQAQAQKIIYAQSIGDLYFGLLTKDSKITVPGPLVNGQTLFR